MEVHFVHRDADGQALVVARMLEVGDSPNSYMARFWKSFPDRAGVSSPLKIEVPYTGLNLKDDMSTSYWHFTGSFTTPPCTVDTVWLMAKQPAGISLEQRDEFRKSINAIP